MAAGNIGGPEANLRREIGGIKLYNGLN